MNLNNVLSKFEQVKLLATGEYSARCPGHDDQKNSLTIRQTDDRILLCCHAHCTLDEILDGAGLAYADLQNGHHAGNGHEASQKPIIVATYDYRDAAGNLLYQSVRYEPKDFKQRQPDGNGGWIWNVTRPQVQYVPYHLSELLQADPSQWVFVVEGEKDADRLAGLGLIATTNVGGACKWKDAYNPYFRGRKVAVIPDNDKAGQEHAAAVAKSLQGTAALIKNVALSGLPSKGDISDWLNVGHTPQELLDLVETSAAVNGAKAGRGDKSEDLLAALATLGYSFRLNACNDVVEVGGEPITDIVRATIRTQMRDLGYKRYLTAIEDAYTAHAAKNQYHPVGDYLESLTYEPGPRGAYKIPTLSTYFKDVDGVFCTWLKRWMVGAVAKARAGEQNVMLVLDGPQDIGKSYFVRWLGSGLSGYHVEAPINTEDKDAWIRLISKWVWEVAELGATIRKADREALKNFITAQSVTVRKPFGRSDITKPALASLIGTINNEAGFLNDPTGSRRFLVCELTSIDWGYTAMDISGLWAEAYWLYRQGEPWRLLPEEKAQQRVINARYRVDLPVMEMLVTHYDIDPAGGDWIAAMEIISNLETKGLKGNQKANLMELSAAMRELGVRRGRQTGLWGYWGIKRKSSLPMDED